MKVRAIEPCRKLSRRAAKSPCPQSRSPASLMSPLRLPRSLRSNRRATKIKQGTRLRLHLQRYLSPLNRLLSRYLNRHLWQDRW